MGWEEYPSKKSTELMVEFFYPWYKSSDEKIARLFGYWLQGMEISPEMESVLEHLVNTKPVIHVTK